MWEQYQALGKRLDRDMAKKMPLKSFRLKNFKAIRDSGDVKFSPLTVLIGDNGSGKSSLLEGLETYHDVVLQDVDSAMGYWRGFEYVVHPPQDSTSEQETTFTTTKSMEFLLSGTARSRAYRTSMRINSDSAEDKPFIDEERLYFGRRKVLERNSRGEINTFDTQEQSISVHSEKSIVAPWIFVTDRESVIQRNIFMGLISLIDAIMGWQFLRLEPSLMGEPKNQRGRANRIRLNLSGSNIAEYLLDIRRLDINAFEGIVETLQILLPYLSDILPTLTSELERAVYLQMMEGEKKIPGWLLSQGTMRILALLALFRHPDPPPLIVIEELENGLDPRAIHLIVDEIQSVVESGRSQIIVTTHSPYLLNLLPLWSIVLVERKDGEPTFSRPVDREDVENWSRRFAPGDLYTMGALSAENVS